MNRLNIFTKYQELIDCRDLQKNLPKPTDKASCRKLAVSALLLSEDNKSRSTQIWTLLAESCARLSLDFTEIVSANNSRGGSILKRMLCSKDWPSCLVIQENLKSGTYDSGTIHRTISSLVIVDNIHHKQFGIIVYPGGQHYGGDLKNDKRDGYGKLYFADNWRFEGQWKNNEKHGLGAFLRGTFKRREDEGLYINDLFCGNPKSEEKTHYFRSIPSFRLTSIWPSENHGQPEAASVSKR